MAYNRFFTFADPALQAQVVNEAQVQAAAEAARQQQRAATMAAIRQEQQAAAEREERRAIREGDIQRQKDAAAEQRRQFDESLKFNRESEASRTTADATRRKEAEQREQYTNILRSIEAADGRSLPTAKELDARIADLLPQHRQLLQEARGRRHAQLLNDFGLIGAEAERLNNLIGTDSGDGKKWTVDRLLKGSNFRNNLLIGPDGRIQSLAIRPRDDVEAPAPTMPGAESPPPMGAIRGFIQRRIDAATPGAGSSRSFEDVRRGLGVGGAASVLPPLPTQSSTVSRGNFLAPPPPPPMPGVSMFVPDRAATSDIVGGMMRNPLPAGRFDIGPAGVEESTLIPSEQFDTPPGGFTGGEKLMQRGLRLIETKRDAALRRLAEARKTYPAAELVERPEGIFISPLPRSTFYAPQQQELESLLAPPVFAPAY